MPGKVWRPRVFQSRFKSREYYIVIGSDMLGGELISIRVEIFDRSDQIRSVLSSSFTHSYKSRIIVFISELQVLSAFSRKCVCVYVSKASLEYFEYFVVAAGGSSSILFTVTGCWIIKRDWRLSVTAVVSFSCMSRGRGGGCQLWKGKGALKPRPCSRWIPHTHTKAPQYLRWIEHTHTLLCWERTQELPHFCLLLQASGFTVRQKNTGTIFSSTFSAPLFSH